MSAIPPSQNTAVNGGSPSVATPTPAAAPSTGSTIAASVPSLTSSNADTNNIPTDATTDVLDSNFGVYVAVGSVLGVVLVFALIGVLIYKGKTRKEDNIEEGLFNFGLKRKKSAKEVGEETLTEWDTTIISAPVDVTPSMEQDFIRAVHESKQKKPLQRIESFEQRVLVKSPSTPVTVMGYALDGIKVEPPLPTSPLRATTSEKHGRTRTKLVNLTVDTSFAQNPSALRSPAPYKGAAGLPSPVSPAAYSPTLYGGKSPTGPPPMRPPPSPTGPPMRPPPSISRSMTQTSPPRSMQIPQPGLHVLPPTPRSFIVPDEYRRSESRERNNQLSGTPNGSLLGKSMSSDYLWRGNDKSGSFGSPGGLGVSVGDPSVLTSGGSPSYNERAGWL